MKIVVDENIPFGAEAFGRLGEVVTMPGRAIVRKSLSDADALMVRSITKVNADLLDGTPVKFVGTATIGVDHVDLDYLNSSGIGFASAPGCNANSVSEYITAALLVLAKRKGDTVAGKTLGVVGVGNVGSRVVAKAEALGMAVLQNDPPLQRETGDERFVPIAKVFDADIVTIHVPLTKIGPDATHHLVDDQFIARLKEGATLLNTSRGAVADNRALLRGIESGPLGCLVLDVFEGEPNIDLTLLEQTDLATPHIAGYSYDGKVTGTAMIYRAACAHFDQTVAWDPATAMQPPEYPELQVASGQDDEEALRALIRPLYNIEDDDARLREIVRLSPDERGPYFDRLRKTYPVRREFQNTTVQVPPGREALRRKIAGLGFRVSPVA